MVLQVDSRVWIVTVIAGAILMAAGIVLVNIPGYLGRGTVLGLLAFVLLLIAIIETGGNLWF